MPSRNPRSALLLDVVTPIVASEGFDLEDLTVSAVGRRSVVRVVVDSDTGVDLDAVATLSRRISEALDSEAAAAVVPDAYQLEVTSPGVDRPLVEPRHWRRAVDRLVTTEVGGSSVTARVVSADTDGVVLGIDGGPRTVIWADLGPGKVQVEFNRPSPSAGVADSDEPAQLAAEES